MTTRIRIALVLALGLVILGCNKNKDEGSQPGSGNPVGRLPPPEPGAGPSVEEVMAKLPGGEEHAAAKRVYASNGCINCHKLGESGAQRGGPGGPPGRKAPDLTSAGAKADRTKQWLADHIREPKTHSPKSGMPPFGADKISDADLALLAEYLASQK